MFHECNFGLGMAEESLLKVWLVDMGICRRPEEAWQMPNSHRHAKTAWNEQPGQQAEQDKFLANNLNMPVGKPQNKSNIIVRMKGFNLLLIILFQ